MTPANFQVAVNRNQIFVAHDQSGIPFIPARACSTVMARSFASVPPATIFRTSAHRKPMRASVPVIDVAILTADRGPLNPLVVDALNQQIGVRLKVHRVIGEPLPTDTGRQQVICRARNEALDRVKGRWLMFVDDDVVLAKDCIAQLHAGLAVWPKFGALAADYRNDCATRRQSRHVAMGATLFRRAWLPDGCFRWEENRCECLCRCYDMRRAGQRIEYLNSAVATHLPRPVPRVVQ